MADIHYNLPLIKTKVSPSDFIKISMSIPLPLTTVEIVDPAKPSAVDIDSLRIHDHMPDPSKLSGHKPTKLLAALVRFQMQNILCKTQGAYPMLKCEEDFSLGRTAFKRIILGIRRAGGHEYERLRAMGSDERPKTKKKRGCKYTSNLQLQPVHEFLLQSERLRRPHVQVPYLHMPDMPTRLQDSART